MNHKFIRSAWNANVCAKCARPSDRHEVFQCEACSSDSIECELIDSMYLCPSCKIKHNAVRPSVTQLTESEAIEQVTDNHKTERIINQVNRLIETDQIATNDGTSIRAIIEKAVKGHINEFKDFFNADTMPIIELEKLIQSDDTITDKRFELAKQLRERIRHLSHCLFEFNHKSVEISAEVKAIQQYMNGLIPQLRSELRTQFAENDINYVPPETKKVPKVRMTIDDRMAENYAKYMKIPLEQAKRLMANKLRSNCTCKETPGVCKVHAS